MRRASANREMELSDVVAKLDHLQRRLDDFIILFATLNGVGQRQIRAVLGVDIARVNAIAKHAKKEKKR